MMGASATSGCGGSGGFLISSANRLRNSEFLEVHAGNGTGLLTGNPRGTPELVNQGVQFSCEGESSVKCQCNRETQTYFPQDPRYS